MSTCPWTHLYVEASARCVALIFGSPSLLARADIGALDPERPGVVGVLVELLGDAGRAFFALAANGEADAGAGALARIAAACEATACLAAAAAAATASDPSAARAAPAVAVALAVDRAVSAPELDDEGGSSGNAPPEPNPGSAVALGAS